MYQVKPGTQTDSRIRLRGKGVPSLRNKNVRGDHYVTFVVQVPTHLSAQAKEALKHYDDIVNGVSGTDHDSEPKAETEKGSTEKKKKSFMDKLKETFEE